MINIVSNVFLIGEYLMDSASIPCAAKISEHTLSIQRFSNFGFAFSIIDECLINPSHHFDLLIWTGNENHAIRLEALVLAHFQHSFVLTVLVNQHASQAEPRRATLFVTQLNQPTRSLKDFRG